MHCIFSLAGPEVKHGRASFPQQLHSSSCSHLPTVCARCPILVQGEMSATVLRFPSSYATLQPRLRQRIHGGNGALSRVKVGLSFNFNKLHDGSTTLVPITMLSGPDEAEAKAPGTGSAEDEAGGAAGDKVRLATDTEGAAVVPLEATAETGKGPGMAGTTVAAAEAKESPAPGFGGPSQAAAWPGYSVRTADHVRSGTTHLRMVVRSGGVDSTGGGSGDGGAGGVEGGNGDSGGEHGDGASSGGSGGRDASVVAASGDAGAAPATAAAAAAPAAVVVTTEPAAELVSSTESHHGRYGSPPGFLQERVGYSYPSTQGMQFDVGHKRAVAAAATTTGVPVAGATADGGEEAQEVKKGEEADTISAAGGAGDSMATTALKPAPLKQVPAKPSALQRFPIIGAKPVVVAEEGGGIVQDTQTAPLEVESQGRRLRQYGRALLAPTFAGPLDWLWSGVNRVNDAGNTFLTGVGAGFGTWGGRWNAGGGGSGNSGSGNSGSGGGSGGWAGSTQAPRAPPPSTPRPVPSSGSSGGGGSGSGDDGGGGGGGGGSGGSGSSGSGGGGGSTSRPSSTHSPSPHASPAQQQHQHQSSGSEASVGSPPPPAVTRPPAPAPPTPQPLPRSVPRSESAPALWRPLGGLLFNPPPPPDGVSAATSAWMPLGTASRFVRVERMAAVV